MFLCVTYNLIGLVIRRWKRYQAIPLLPQNTFSLLALFAFVLETLAPPKSKVLMVEGLSPVGTEPACL